MKNDGRQWDKRARNKMVYMPTALLALGACMVLGGCSLAREEVGGASQDRLAGVFVTDEYIVLEPKLETGMDGEIRFVPQERKIYATVGDFSEANPVRFENLEGYGAYASLSLWDEAMQQYVGYSACDEVFADGHYEVADGGKTALKTTIYVGENGPKGLFFNPVYQQEDGSVYLVPGNGLTWGSFAEGSSSTHTVSEERSVTENGEERSVSTSISVTVAQRSAPESLKLIFMDGENHVLQVTETDALRRIAQGALQQTGQDAEPEIQVPAGAEYLVLEQEMSDGRVERSIYGREDRTVDWMEQGEDGYMYSYAVALAWE